MRITFKLLTLGALMISINATRADASLLIDDFLVGQAVIQPTSPGSTSGPTQAIAGVMSSRTITVSIVPGSSFAAGVGSSSSTGFFSESFTGPNSAPGTSSVNVGYVGIGSQDVTVGGNTGISFSASSQGGSLITFTAAGSPAGVSTATIPDAPGFSNYFLPFSSFTNPSVFATLTSMTINTTFPNNTGSGPSLTFSGPIIFGPSNPVPEPGTFGMAAIAVLLAGGYRVRRRTRSSNPAA